jgi:type VI secretion system protein ImpF
MARRTELERTVLPSLLERLTDTAPDRAGDPAPSFEASARAFREAVQRDLEWLLNSRRTIVPVPDSLGEVRASAFTYGLEDLTGQSFGTAEGRERLLHMVQEAVARFEPRLAHAQVRLVDAEWSAASPQARFTIEATLLMDPSPERVVFDTVLEVASGTYAVDAGAPPAR